MELVFKFKNRVNWLAEIKKERNGTALTAAPTCS